jgi:protein-S-isoprenylcysteine O-methyltransferase Ste14
MNVALRPPAPTLIKARRRHTVWFAFLAVALLLFTDSAWPAESLVHENLELAGYAALVVCVLGRIACAAYIGGRKNDAIVADGPYSVVRNPLYLFSFIGVAGIGLGTGTITIPLALLAIFALYYPHVVAREEAFLAERYGDAYRAYVRSVPRWLPDFSRWRSPAEIAVKPRFLLVTMRDSALFFAALPLLEMLDWLHAAGHLPVLLRLP